MNKQGGEEEKEMKKTTVFQIRKTVIDDRNTIYGWDLNMKGNPREILEILREITLFVGVKK